MCYENFGVERQLLLKEILTHHQNVTKKVEKLKVIKCFMIKELTIY